MARAKIGTRKSNSLSEKDRYTAELSTGQLVIGVCILLMFGLACFLMGVVIGKFDPTLAPEAALQSQPIQAATTGADVDATGVARADDAVARDSAKAPPEMRVPLKTEQEPSRAAAATSQEPAKEPVKLAQVAPAEPKKVVQTEIVKPVVRVEPSFGVQIAALRTRERAEVVKRDLEERTSYSAQLVRTENGRLVRVVVGSYADKLSASQARDDLKRNYGFSDCWVVDQ